MEGGGGKPLRMRSQEKGDKLTLNGPVVTGGEMVGHLEMQQEPGENRYEISVPGVVLFIR